MEVDVAAAVATVGVVVAVAAAAVAAVDNYFRSGLKGCIVGHRGEI